MTTRSAGWIAATAAALLVAVAALVVALTAHGVPGPRGPAGHAGPAGATGKAGATGQAAQTARLGVCWSFSTQSSADGATTWVSSVSIDQPLLQNGVYVCPQGDQFVSIVPAPR